MRYTRYLSLIFSLLLFTGGVSAAEPDKKESSLGLGTGFAKTDFRKEPTFIKSDSLTVQSEKRIFTYTGHVEVKQADMILTCDELEGRYTEANQIDELIAKRNILIVKGDKIKATGQKGVYTAKTGVLVLTENPNLEQNGSTLSADTIRVFLQEDRSVAEGDVRVTLVNNKTTPVPLESPVAGETPTPQPGVSFLGDQ